MTSRKVQNGSRVGPTAAPVLVEVIRGEIAENRHRGSVAIADPRGKIIAAWGDIEAPTFLRSAAKPIQALALIETGAADHFRLSDREIALACASHDGESIHVDAIAAWLQRVGLSATDLECGVHPPMDEITAAEYVRCSRQPTRLVNGCSGQHTGFLTTACHLGEETRGYIQFEHPIQRRLIATVSEMTDCDLRSMPAGTDGCGIPVIALPLRAAATGMARLGSPTTQSAVRTAATRRVFDAMVAHPTLIGGNTRFDTRAIAAADGEAIIKMGADGIQVAALKAAGLGIAVKIEDGNQRAAEVVMATILEKIFHRDPQRGHAFSSIRDRQIRNWNGTVTGRARPAADWLHQLQSLRSIGSRRD